MDSEIVQASRSLQAGRPLEALAGIGTRRDAHATAIRGIALAQLGELDRSRTQLQQAVMLFRRAREPLWMAKAMAALAEVDLARRDLPSAARRLDSRGLRALGDRASAAYVDIQRARLLALLGRFKEAERLLRRSGAAATLARAELLAMKGRFTASARMARRVRTSNPLLRGEADRLYVELTRRCLLFELAGRQRRISMVQLERWRGPYVDTVRKRFGALDLWRRPVQVELLTALARGPVTAARLFERSNESHDARIKMEVSRLRRETGLRIVATRRGFVMPPVGVLLPSMDPIETLLADGEAWPPRAIAQVLGLTVRSVERALADSLSIVSMGRGRARRYRLRRAHPEIAAQLLLLSSRR